MKPTHAVFSALPALLLHAACGQETAPGRTATPSPQRYEVHAIVLQNAGPQLCWAVKDFLPPQCGGPDVVGWQWDAVKSETVRGVTWGSYLLTGTWDGTHFTLTEPAKAGSAKGKTDIGTSKEPDFSPPCPPPSGGWKPVDRSKAADRASERAFQLQDDEAQFAGGWIYELPAQGNEPDQTLLIIRFTPDLPRHEREIRKLWGGPLCLTTPKHSQAELRKISAQLGDLLPHLYTAGTDVVRNAASARILLVTKDIQRDMDRRFGPGMVHLEGVMHPIGEAA